MTSTQKQALGPNQKKWINALRSGKFEQGRGYLNLFGKFCCLGIACEIFKDKTTAVGRAKTGPVLYNGREQLAPTYVMQSLCLYDRSGGDCVDYGNALAKMNDEGMSFPTIADLLENEPQRFFKEAR